MAREFDGTNDEIAYMDDPALEDAELTMYTWIYFNSLASDQIVWGKGQVVAFTNEWQTWQDVTAFISGRTNTFTVSISDGSGTERLEGATNAAQQDVWQSVLGRIAPNVSGGLELWVGGSEDANSPVDTTFTTFGANIHPFSIGTATNGNRDFDGRQAEVVLWSGSIPDTHKTALAHGVNPFFVLGVKPLFYSPVWGNQDPEPQWGTIVGTGNVTGAVKAVNHPPVELLENYL